MGTKGNRVAGVLYSSDPRHYDRVDWVFALGFVSVVSGALAVFWTDSAPDAMVSIVVMFVAICVMLLCLGFEDLLGKKDGSHDGGGDEAEASAADAFKDGDAFDECEMGRGIGRKKGPKGKT